jgi:hypothetical protein
MFPRMSKDFKEKSSIPRCLPRGFFISNSFWFNTPPLGARNWGCGGFVPPHTQRFQGEIFNTSLLAAGIFILMRSPCYSRAWIAESLPLQYAK